MTTLLNVTITTAVTAVVSNNLVCHDGAPSSAVIQCAFTYGSGGTTVDVWVQTSFDFGASWVDIANFNFATSSAVKVANLSALTPVTTYTPTDGTLEAHTAKDGVLGPLYCVKYTKGDRPR